MPQVTFHQFEPVPAGTYRVKIKTCVERRAANIPNAEPFLAWGLEIINHPTLQGKPISYAMNYSLGGPNSKSSKFFKALGFEPSKPGDFKLNTDDFLGRECFVQVTVTEKHQDGNVIRNNKIENFLSVAEMMAAVNPVGQPQYAQQQQPLYAQQQPQYVQPPQQQQVQPQSLNPTPQNQNFGQNQNYNYSSSGNSAIPNQLTDIRYEPVGNSPQQTQQTFAVNNNPGAPTRPIEGAPSYPQTQQQGQNPNLPNSNVVQDNDDMKFPKG